MELAITTHPSAERYLIAVEGEIDISNADKLRNAIDLALEQPTARVELDFSQVPYIDSTGIGVLVGAARRASERERALSITGAQPNVLRVAPTSSATQSIWPSSSPPSASSSISPRFPISIPRASACWSAPPAAPLSASAPCRARAPRRTSCASRSFWASIRTSASAQPKALSVRRLVAGRGVRRRYTWNIAALDGARSAAWTFEETGRYPVLGIVRKLGGIPC